MEFYIFRVLFPAVLLDVALTVGLLKGNVPRRNRNALSAFATAPLYLAAALVWIVFFGLGDPRFQGQGVLGLMVLWMLGITFTIIRLFFGLVLFLILRRR